MVPNKSYKPNEIQPHQHPINRVVKMRGESPQLIIKPTEQIRSFTPQRVVLPKSLTHSYSKGGFLPSNLFASQKSSFLSRQELTHPSDSNIAFMNEKLDDSKMKTSKIERKMGLSLTSEQRSKLLTTTTEGDSSTRHHGKENSQPKQPIIK
jgi:hypothetical protein